MRKGLLKATGVGDQEDTALLIGLALPSQSELCTALNPTLAWLVLGFPPLPLIWAGSGFFLPPAPAALQPLPAPTSLLLSRR